MVRRYKYQSTESSNLWHEYFQTQRLKDVSKCCPIQYIRYRTLPSELQLNSTPNLNGMNPGHLLMETQSDLNSMQSMDTSNATQRMDPSFLMDAFMGQYVNMDEEEENLEPLELITGTASCNEIQSMNSINALNSEPADLVSLRPDTTPSSRNLGRESCIRSAATMGEKERVVLEREDSWTMSLNGTESAPSVKSAVSGLSVKSAPSATNGTAGSGIPNGIWALEKGFSVDEEVELSMEPMIGREGRNTDSNTPQKPLPLTDELLSTLDKCVRAVSHDLMEHKEIEHISNGHNSNEHIRNAHISNRNMASVPLVIPVPSTSCEGKMEMKEYKEVTMVKVTDIGQSDEFLQQLGEENNEGLLWKLLLENKYRDREEQFVGERYFMYKQWFNMDIGKWIYRLGHWRRRRFCAVSRVQSPQPVRYLQPARTRVQNLRAYSQPRIPSLSQPNVNVPTRRQSTNNSSPVVDSAASTPSVVDSLELYKL